MTPLLPVPQPVRYKDISLTFNTNPVTGDITTLTDADAIAAAVKMLVMTINYEIPFTPDQGCQVYSSLFENISQTTAMTIRRSIADVLNNYEPRISTLGVEVTPSPDQHAYAATIIYQILGQSQTTTLNIFLEQLR